MSSIEWTDETWNVTSGCTRVSAGCDNCYAVNMTRRLAGMQATKDKYGGLINDGKKHFNGVVKCHEDELEKPLKWRKPRRVFVNSMSDLFHPEVPFEFIDKVFAVMALASIHTFQILTKRPERMAEYFNRFETIGEIKDHWGYAYVDWKSRRTAKAVMNPNDVWDHLEYTDWPLPNVWLGTSVENQDAANERIPHLLKVPAAVRFLSCEPLLGPVNLTALKSYSGVGNYLDAFGPDVPGSDLPYSINWVIAGGESGPNARPMHPDWVRQLRDQCKEASVPFFFKQWGSWAPGSNKGKGEVIVLKDAETFTYPAPKIVRSIYSESEWNDQEPNIMNRAGKKKAGRLLDGVEHNEYPEATRCP
jgi:protein gp37